MASYAFYNKLSSFDFFGIIYLFIIYYYYYLVFILLY